MPPKTLSPRLTHFLCLPLVNPSSRSQLQTSLSTFRQAVTNKSTPENPDGIPERAIRPLGTLHLTLGVMSLLSEERVEAALACLKSLDLEKLLVESVNSGRAEEGNTKGKGEVKGKEAGGAKELRVTLRGITTMHTPSKTSVLYSSPVDPDRTLQSFCQSLWEAFINHEFIIPENRPLLLHATILNTIYVPGVRGKSGNGGHGKHKAKLTIDATEILEDWTDHEWMKDVRIEKVAICRMGAKKLENGEEEYVIEGELEMP